MCPYFRHLRPHRQPPHPPSLPVIIVHSIVLSASVIPNGQHLRRPANAEDELGPHLVLDQVTNQRFALFFGHALEIDGMAAT